LAGGMHAIAFRLKMGHLRNLAFGRKAVVKVRDMTPARFDLLYAIRQVAIALEDVPSQRLLHGMDQRDLVRKLGVVKSVTSRMLKRLEELAWVRRVRCEDDRRRKYVTLTKKGLRQIWKGMRRVFRGRIFLKWYEDFFREQDPKRHVLDAVHKGFQFLWDLARGLEDHSYLHYDYGVPEDH
jgi:DNA-binding MarR family transcriptional regulator